MRLDLSTFSEATRQALYDLAVRDNFKPCEPQADPDDVWVPPYTAEEAGLEVYFQHGRWFVTWQKLEVPAGAPEAERRELLRLVLDPHEPENVIYREF